MHQQIIRERLVEFERKLALLDVGDPLEKARNLFPGSGDEVVDGDGEMVFWLVSGYDENPACTNIWHTRFVIKVVCGTIATTGRSSGPIDHQDRFGFGGPLYYFGRAWYSSVRDSDER